ncbi:MAG: MarR family transcriptional regulator [Lautropia sp.]|nr:MAG: MarR family transcriptional regulator [Pseudomonadota bacterium]MBC6959777.1 MarR family transcriptional regulator [Lautropia sp.]MCL4702083.1 MarR family winged helix-turn-helix transcriptional regulator [Burkholderiaceae bacterium]MDL1908184.1 winged helix-turn-helix transcriptional regulator [Betaproteobacteria bacterium PRO1]RIK89173.1 MAG: MarR family transcriptional regulator [Burkholderiales bacterium]
MTSAKPFYDAATYPAGESVGFLVRQLRMSFTHCIDRTMAEYDLTDAQWGPLLLIARGRARTAAALAQALDLDAGAMTRTLDRLQAKGLIRRTRSREDRRVWVLELTPAGEQAAAQVPAGLAHANNVHLAGFDRKEFEQLRAYLVRMIDNGRHERAAADTPKRQS